MTTFFTSDTHFGDSRVLKIDRRPFASVAAHDAALIGFWNEIVSAEDEVWHLGDFALGPTPEAIDALLARLNGVKHLITGNNDGPATLVARGWTSVQSYAEIVVEEIPLVLCHYAFRTWNGMGRGRIDLHGHSHGRLTPMPKQYDVGVDAWDYRPVRLGAMLGTRRRGAVKRPAEAPIRGPASPTSEP